MKNLSLFIILCSFSFLSVEVQAKPFCQTKLFGWLCKNKGNTRGNTTRRTQPRNEARQTEASYDLAGTCRDCAPRVRGLSRIPANNPAKGVIKVMQSTYRTCNIGVYDQLPNYGNYTCLTNPSNPANGCKGNQSSTRPLVLTNTTYNGKPGYLTRKVNSGYKNNYSQRTGDVNKCPAVVNGQNYASSKKTFSQPSNYKVSFQGKRAVINMANCGSATQGGNTCGIERGSVPTITHECFKMYDIGLKSQCLKMHPTEKVTRDSKGEMMVKIQAEPLYSYTGLGLRLSRKPDSCLAQPNINLKNVKNGNDPYAPLMIGDAIVQSGGGGNHTWVITELRNDPLGIQDIIKKNRPCNSLNVNDLDFTIAQSTGVRSAGAINVNVKAYKDVPYMTAPMGQLIAFAKNLCAKAKNPQGVNAVNAQSLSDKTFGIIRHKSMMGNAPQCKFSADECPKILGDECGKNCSGEAV